MPKTHPFVIGYNPATPIYQILVKGGPELNVGTGLWLFLQCYSKNIQYHRKNELASLMVNMRVATDGLDDNIKIETPKPVGVFFRM